VLGKSEPACLLIADISGYTSFLAGAELDHAQDVLADLVGTVVGSLRPTFRLAKLEGDAAFAYQLADSLDPAAIQDAVERCYFTFRRRLRDIGQASSCDCNSCNLVPTLDLKLVLHHGPSSASGLPATTSSSAARSSSSTASSRTMSSTAAALAPTRSTPTRRSLRWASRIPPQPG
jgi:hypothetical protein